MLIERMRKRLAADRARFIEPCLPSSADKPPSGSTWIHEIKHAGFRLMARRDPVGIRLITRRGNDWTSRYPLVVEAVNHLKVRSCVIDGEVVCLRRRANRGAQGNAGQHPATEPAPACGLNEHLEHDCGQTVFQHACKMGLEGIVSKRLGSRYRSGRSTSSRTRRHRL